MQAQVIDGKLCSPANAGSLLKGDMIEVDGELCTIARHPERQGPTVKLVFNWSGHPIARWFVINEPVCRVVGARSGGQI